MHNLPFSFPPLNILSTALKVQRVPTNIRFKGAVSVISSDLPCKEDNVGFTRVLFQTFD